MLESEKRISEKHNAWSRKIPRRPRSRKVIWSVGSGDLIDTRFEAWGVEVWK